MASNWRAGGEDCVNFVMAPASMAVARGSMFPVMSEPPNRALPGNQVPMKQDHMNLSCSMDRDAGYWKGDDRLSHDGNPHLDRTPHERGFERGPMLEKQSVGLLNVAVIDYQHKTREESLNIVDRVDKRYSPHDVRDISDGGPSKKMRYNEDNGQAAYGMERNMLDRFVDVTPQNAGSGIVLRSILKKSKSSSEVCGREEKCREDGRHDDARMKHAAEIFDSPCQGKTHVLENPLTDRLATSTQDKDYWCRSFQYSEKQSSLMSVEARSPFGRSPDHQSHFCREDNWTPVSDNQRDSYLYTSNRGNPDERDLYVRNYRDERCSPVGFNSRQSPTRSSLYRWDDRQSPTQRSQDRDGLQSPSRRSCDGREDILSPSWSSHDKNDNRHSPSQISHGRRDGRLSPSHRSCDRREDRHSPSQRSHDTREDRQSPSQRSHNSRDDVQSPRWISHDRRSPSCRSCDGRDNRQSPCRRSLDRNEGRRSPSLRSQDRRDNRQSPIRRSRDRRDDRQSPSLRSRHRNESRQSPARRSHDRNEGRQSPSGRSYDRRDNRLSPSLRSCKRSEGRQSPSENSYDRRDNRLSQSLRSCKRSEGRQSPSERSYDRRDNRLSQSLRSCKRSEGRQSPSERSYDRRDNRLSPSLRSHDRSERRQSPSERSYDRRDNRLSPSLRSHDRNEAGQSPSERSYDRRDNRLSPCLRSRNRSERRQSPSERSCDRRDSGLSPSLRSRDRNEGRQSPSERSYDRRDNRLSPSLRSRNRSEGRLSPSERSYDRRDNRLSPSLRSRDRNEGRQSPIRRSRDRRDRFSPTRRSYDRRDDRQSPCRGYRDDWPHRQDTMYSPYNQFLSEWPRKSPDRSFKDDFSPDRFSLDERIAHDSCRGDRYSPIMVSRDERRSPNRRSKGHSRSSRMFRKHSSPHSSPPRQMSCVRDQSDRGSAVFDDIWKCTGCGLQNHTSRAECYRCGKVRDQTEEEPSFSSMFYPPLAVRPSNSCENARRRIHVSNLPMCMSAEELFNMYSECGKVVYSNIVIDQVAKRSKGFGFVAFNTASEAAYAVTRTFRLKGNRIYGSHVKLMEAKPSCLGDTAWVAVLGSVPQSNHSATKVKLSAKCDAISSDEEASGTMFKCKVDCCGFQGTQQQFHNHWKEIHLSSGKFLLCPVCDTGCADRSSMRSHLMQGHGVTSEGKTMDNILRNVKMEWKRNPFYVEPGCSEKNAMVEISGNSENVSAQKRHKTLKVYKCPERGCLFAASAKSFILHWNSKHLESSSILTCPVCSVDFVEKTKLIEHFRNEHKTHSSVDVIEHIVAGAEKVSSDEDEEELKMLSGRFICKVEACDFHGSKSAFRRHWEERHVLNQTYFKCPYCSFECSNQAQIRYHMVRIHKVQITDPILDDALTRTFAKERRNPNFLDPGNVEREAKIEICVKKPPPSFDQKNTLRSKNAAEKLRENKSGKKATSKTTKEAVSVVNNPPDYLLMKYNGQKADSIKAFLAWTDQLMENLEMAHQKAKKKLQEYDKNSKHKKSAENSKLQGLKENNSKLEEPDDSCQLKELEKKKGDLQDVPENIKMKKHEEENTQLQELEIIEMQEEHEKNSEMQDLENIDLQEFAENSELQEIDEENSEFQKMEDISELQEIDENNELQNVEENSEPEVTDEESSELQVIDEVNSEHQEFDEENSELGDLEENSELQGLDEEKRELHKIDEENSELQNFEEKSELQDLEENSELPELDEENSELHKMDEENSELQEHEESSELQELDEENFELLKMDEENSELQEHEESSELQELDEENFELLKMDEENSELQEHDSSELQDLEEDSELQDLEEDSELQDLEEDSELQDFEENGEHRDLENSEMHELDKETCS